ncbi:E3 ubiquitin-protein ligase TRIM21-like [Alosa sapidissima]|uniref:E3 ubiquitin-protein ligase TRIM21-like n=1 Tax=Alosa sapidissima TaxID=34773 RepID=UPI001C088264|nr:E3 ubiquitin-protein ligase TRIM21-like [Alosa sapidissima]
MNAFPKRSQQRLKHSEIQDRSACRNHGPYKLAVVFLGLLCVLLLAVIIIGLFIKTEETRQLQLRYNNLTEEKEQLQLRYNNLTEEKDQLDILNNLNRENEQLQLRYNNLAEEKYQLETLNNNLIREKEQSQSRNTMLNTEKSLLETNISAIVGERDELQSRLCKLESHDMKRIKSHAVDVTLDTDTAHASLILSADRKQVANGDTQQSVPDSHKRFGPVICVLGKQGFSSGKFYYEVQVEGKPDWTLGVARESITRKGNITLSPENGYWTIWLRNGTEYEALADPSVPLSLKEKPQRVGVFVDYEAGLVSFYDADCWYHLYSYANVKFTEKLYPFFYPGLNDGGKNSSPLIISSVSICPIS